VWRRIDAYVDGEQLVPTLAELRLEQLVQGAAGEAGGEERLRSPHDLPLPVGNLKGRIRGSRSGMGHWVDRGGSGVGQG
jgi:hypothetical protein